MYRYLERHPRLARWLEAIGGVVLINLIGLLAALPVVTGPPALAGVFAYTSRIARGEHPDLVRDFLVPLRQLFVRSWVTVAMGAAVAGLVVLNLSLVGSQDIPLGGIIGALSIVLGVGWILVNLYLWPLLVLVDRPYREIVTLSMRLALGHLPWSLALLALVASLWLLAMFSPMLVVLIAFAGTCLTINAGAWRVIRRYTVSAAMPDSSGPG